MPLKIGKNEAIFSIKKSKKNIKIKFRPKYVNILQILVR